MLARKALAGTAGAPKEYVEDVFSTYLINGTTGSQTITNGIDLSGDGGLVWLKARNGADSHYLIDSARGSSKYLLSNDTAAEGTNANLVSSLNADGFTLGTSGYGSGTTAVSWSFRKAKKFFDVVTYTGNGTAGRTVSHNLGSVPGVIIVKCTSAADNWTVYHRSLGGTKFLELNATGAAGTSASRWNDTDPTSTVFTVGSDGAVNGNGSSYVAYLFAHDAGGFGDAGSDSIIKCGSYTTNGTAFDIDLGWEPQWLLTKRSDSATGGNWLMCDNMRGWQTDGTVNYVLADLNNAEDSGTWTPITSKGFKAQTNSGYTYIYIAIRRGPMKTPTSGTSVYAASTYSASSPQYTSGFPVDWWFRRYDRTSASDYTIAMTRLTGDAYLETRGTGAETTGSGVKFDFNNGASINGASNAFGWLFRRAPGFFDVVCYTGTGATPQNITHNLGVAPELMIVKVRNEVRDWTVYSGNAGQYLLLDTTDAVTSNTNVWDNTAPSSTVFRVGNFGTTNSSGKNIVAYLFASVAGVSKVGSYTGNGSSQTINCGFTAGTRFVLIKRTDSTGDWVIFDSTRGIVSGNDPYIALNTTAAEVTNKDAVDTDNTGFIVNETTGPNINTNGGTYIYLAIA